MFFNYSVWILRPMFMPILTTGLKLFCQSKKIILYLPCFHWPELPSNLCMTCIWKRTVGLSACRFWKPKPWLYPLPRLVRLSKSGRFCFWSLKIRSRTSDIHTLRGHRCWSSCASTILSHAKWPTFSGIKHFRFPLAVASRNCLFT